MPEHESREHTNGLAAAPPTRGAAVVTPAIGQISLSNTSPPATPGRRAGGNDESSVQAVSEASPGPHRGARERLSELLQYLDVVLVVVATPVAIALGAPAFGCLVGAVAWVALRVLGQADKRWVARAAEPRTRLGLSLFEAFGRIWLLAVAIIVAGVAGGRADGLTAALVIFCAYSIAFAIRVLSGPPTAQRKVLG